MNIVIDIGNSFIKIAVFNQTEMLWNTKTNADKFVEVFYEVSKQYPEIQNLLFSATGHIDKPWINIFKTHYRTFTFSHKTPLSFDNLYQTPETIGLDRLALVSAANKLYKYQNVLIIDAGTCITYDLITSESKYIGGNISPGIDMRFKALHEFTAKLPRLKRETPMSFPLGKTTKDAMLNGVIQGVIFEIEQNIDRYKADYKDLTVILTGGDQQYLSAQLKNSIFANPTFQLDGLNAILENLLND